MEVFKIQKVFTQDANYLALLYIDLNILFNIINFFSFFLKKKNHLIFTYIKKKLKILRKILGKKYK